MKFNDSPLDYLVAFTISFAAGALSALGLAKYITTIKAAQHNDKHMPPV